MSRSYKNVTFIDSVANELGIQNLNPKIVSDLERNIKNEFQQIIQESLKFARHSYRTKILASDVKCAFNMRNIPPIIGTSQHLPFYNNNQNDNNNNNNNNNNNKSVKNQSNIMIKKDPFITLNDLKNNDILKPAQINVIVQWMAINGKVLTSSNINNTNVNMSNNNNNSNKNDGVVVIKPLIAHDISKEQQLFFEVLTNAVISRDVSKLEIFLNILENADAGLIRLVPRIVSFIASIVKSSVTSSSCDLLLLSLCMRIAESLILSKYLSAYLEKYLQGFMPPILTCCLKDRLSISPFDNHWNLRDKSAKIVKLVLDKFGDKFPKVKIKTLKTLIKHFKNINLSFTTHYGCIICMKYLGINALQNGLLPNIINYVNVKLKYVLENSSGNNTNTATNTNQDDDDDDNDIDMNNNNNACNMDIKQNIRKQYEAKMVFTAILECLWICFEYQQKQPSFGGINCDDKDNQMIMNIYKELQDMFGESLLPFNQPPPGCDGYFI